MFSRICIRDLPGNIINVDDEIRALIGKICPVIDIYLPSITVTGIRRDFAMVTVNADNDTIKKCVKVFNNCHWKGGKIKVEIANEYYKDRLKRERDEDESTDIESTNDINNDNDTKVNDTNDIDKDSYIKKDYITIKKVRSSKRIMISTLPSLFPLTSKFKKVVIPAKANAKPKPKPKGKGKDKLNNDDSMIIYHCGWKITFDDDGNPIKPEIAAPVENTTDDVVEVDNENDEKPAAVQADVDTKPIVSTQILKEVGGGLRRGFGTLLSSNNDKKKIATTTTTTVDDSDDKKSGPSIDECGCLPMANEVPENDFIDHNPYMSDDDDVPCVTEQELQEENLAKERDRMKLLLGSVLGIEPSPYTNTEKAAVNINKIQVKTWGDIFIKRYDPTKEDSKRYEAGTYSKEDNNNFDSNEEDDENDENDDDDDENDDDEDDDDDDDNNNTELDMNSNENMKNNDDNNEITKNRDSVIATDTTALRNIFHKQDGGVWWGDDGTLKETVAQGNAASDLIFREAEKMGIDVRSDGNDDDKVMKFSFFDDNEDSTETDKATNNYNNNSQSVNISNTDDNDTLKIQPPMSLIDIVKNAKKFQRDKSIDELRKDWLDTRDKLKLDYKRKRKDDKKKKGLNNERSPYNRNETVALNSKVDSIPSSSSQKRMKSHRGGVKNKKKSK